MKGIKLSICCLVAVVFLISITVAPAFAGKSLWPKKKGELCWEDESGDSFIRTAVVRTVKKHYLIHGTRTESDGTIHLFSGNAEIVGDKVIMQTTSAGSDENHAFGFIGSGVLDKETLNGTTDGVGFYFDRHGDDNGFSYNGTMNIFLVPCSSPGFKFHEDDDD
jgi:hypothetical protein